MVLEKKAWRSPAGFPGGAQPLRSSSSDTVALGDRTRKAVSCLVSLLRSSGDRSASSTYFLSVSEVVGPSTVMLPPDGAPPGKSFSRFERGLSVLSRIVLLTHSTSSRLSSEPQPCDDWGSRYEAR